MKVRLYIIFSMLAAAGLAMAGCQESDADKERYVAFREKELAMPILEVQESIMILCIGKWEVYGDEITLQEDGTGRGPWYTIDKMSGSGNYHLKITSDFNDTDDQRTGEIYVRSENSDKLEIYQPGGSNINLLMADKFLAFNLQPSVGTDRNGDGILSTWETALVGAIDLNEAGVGLKGTFSSIEGIGYFPNITSLICNDNVLAALDLSYNKQLTYLDCSGNASLSAATLVVAKCAALEEAHCNGLSVDSLKFYSHPALRVLEARDSYNKTLKYVGVEDNSVLTSLDCSNNNIAELNLAGKPALESLVCPGNANLKVINITGCSFAVLQTLDCTGAHADLVIQVWEGFDQAQIPAGWVYPASTTFEVLQ